MRPALVAIAAIATFVLVILLLSPRAHGQDISPRAAAALRVTFGQQYDRHTVSPVDPFAKGNATRAACGCYPTCTCASGDCGKANCPTAPQSRQDAPGTMIRCSDGKLYPLSAWGGRDPWEGVTVPAYYDAAPTRRGLFRLRGRASGGCGPGG